MPVDFGSQISPGRHKYDSKLLFGTEEQKRDFAVAQQSK
jgi:hypothetical protein